MASGAAARGPSSAASGAGPGLAGQEHTADVERREYGCPPAPLFDDYASLGRL